MAVEIVSTVESLSIFVLLIAAIAITVVAPIYLLGRWILDPIDRLAKSRNAPPRLYLADFFCLFLAVQIPLAFVDQVRGPDTEAHFWVFSIITWLAAPLIWIMCARTVSRAGVTRGWQRIVFPAAG